MRFKNSTWKESRTGSSRDSSQAASADSRRFSERRHPLLRIHSALGNQGVQQLVRGPLRRGPGDPREAEAERIAEATVNGPRAQGRRSASLVPREVIASPGASAAEPVRLHTDPEAAAVARMLRARAVTSGRDVFFAKGAFDPSRAAGRRLLAHELAHVAQQAGSGRAIQRQEEEESGPSPGTQAAGDVSVHVGRTMTAEAALREIYEQGAREISEEALRRVASGEATVEEAARWATRARNDLKVQIRARGSPVTRGLAEARNVRKYGNKVGPTFDDLIRQGKTPEDIIGSAGRSNTRVNRVATRFRVAGRFLILIDVAIVTWEVVEAPADERLRTAVSGAGGVAGALAGGWAGAKGGAAAGGFIGSFFGPGPGTAIGGAIGGVVGGVGGAIAGGWAAREATGAAYDVVEELVTPDLDAQMEEVDAAEDAYIWGQAR